jgi:hypothetical protein
MPERRRAVAGHATRWITAAAAAVLIVLIAHQASQRSLNVETPPRPRPVTAPVTVTAKLPPEPAPKPPVRRKLKPTPRRCAVRGATAGENAGARSGRRCVLASRLRRDQNRTQGGGLISNYRGLGAGRVPQDQPQTRSDRRGSPPPRSPGRRSFHSRAGRYRRRWQRAADSSRTFG